MTNPLLDRKLIHYPGVVCFHDSPAEIEGVLVSVCRILLRERRAPIDRLQRHCILRKNPSNPRGEHEGNDDQLSSMGKPHCSVIITVTMLLESR